MSTDNTQSHPHHITFTAYIDSSTRTSGTPSNFNCVIDLPPNNFDRVCLLQASIPKSWYLFDSTNNTFILREVDQVAPFGTYNLTITIPVGNYTRINLASIVASLLNTASSSLLGGPYTNTYTITYPTSAQTNTNKYTYTSTSTSAPTLKTSSFVFSSNNCCIPFGFNNSSTNAFTQVSLVGTLISVNAINLSSKTRLYIKSDLCELSNKSILQEIYSTNIQDNGIIVYVQSEIEANSKLFFSNSDNLFNIQLTDRFDSIVDLNGLDITLSIHFYTTDDTNKYIKNDIILKNLQNEV